MNRSRHTRSATQGLAVIVSLLMLTGSRCAAEVSATGVAHLSRLGRAIQAHRKIHGQAPHTLSQLWLRGFVRDFNTFRLADATSRFSSIDSIDSHADFVPRGADNPAILVSMRPGRGQPRLGFRDDGQLIDLATGDVYAAASTGGRSGQPLPHDMGVIPDQFADVTARATPDIARLGQLLWARKIGDALDEYRRLADLHTSDPGIRSGWAAFELLAGDRKVGAAEAQRLTRDFPRDARSWAVAAQATYSQGDIEGARKLSARAVELDPTMPQRYFEEAVQFYQKGVYEPAMQLFAAVLLMDYHGYYVSHFYLGYIYRELKMPERAMAEFEYYLRQDAKGERADKVRDTLRELRARPK